MRVNEMSLKAGDRVKILSVESCARDLPQEDQLRLNALVGKVRTVVDIDKFGFPWLSFEASGGADFSLLPTEVQIL